MDPIFLALATALASRFGNEGAGAAWSALVRLVRRRATAEPGMKLALESAQTAPEEKSIHRLADELRRAADSNVDFGASIYKLWPEADRELTVTSTQNQINGIVLGNALQAGTVNVKGDLKFGKP